MSHDDAASISELARRLNAQLEAIDPVVLELARSAKNVSVLSGAGISAESGVPTFRAPETGLWARYSPQELATPEAWEENPDLVWSWYIQRARMVRGVQPNAGHAALARWAAYANVSISTQNIDDLHERAGSKVLAHLHGSLFEFCCEACGRPADRWQVGDLRLDSPVDDDPQPAPPPECLECDSRIRPRVVWFGESLPMDAFAAAEQAMADSDLVLVVGTSGIVQPAASLPLTALGLGIPVVEINPEPTDFSAYADYTVRLPSGTALPLITAGL
ncbi:NAD-dependent deacylase [Kocuria coralli]|uniref:NAD-dependent protein deacylase n=1 Tax=Kocuria coralli TaxID=1461025 RepID=A0A5J5KVQ3_9MICC|nr:NAD-dependent deacylase [Kocuria coralli]KAA9392976.1 NAD-dependent deacylase [Kocuria coralli]